MNTVPTADRGTTIVDPHSAHRHTHRCWWDLQRAAWRCSASVTTVDPRPETVVEHQLPI